MYLQRVLDGTAFDLKDQFLSLGVVPGGSGLGEEILCPTFAGAPVVELLSEQSRKL